MTTGTPSPVRRTSNSIPSAPASMAAWNAAIVFSGATADAPRWPIISGTDLLRSSGRVGNDALQFDIESAVLGLRPSGYRNVPFIRGHPDRKLALVFVHQPSWSKQLRIDAQHVDAAKHRLHSFLLDDLHRNLVNAAAVADEDVETLSDFQF